MATVAALLAQSMPNLAMELCGTPSSRSGDTWRFRRRGSLAIEVSGPKRGSWYDHEAGTGGDALDLIANRHGASPHEAWRWALARLGAVAVAPILRAVAQAEKPRVASPPKTLALARRIWSEALAPDACGSPISAYLGSRGLALPVDAPLRFHPRTWRNVAHGPHGPSMVALMTDPVSNEPCGVHVSHLRADGTGKAEGLPNRVMHGNTGIIRLAPDESVTLGLGICEGLETGLSLSQNFGWGPIWVAASAGGISTFAVLRGVEALTIFADADGPGLKAADACAVRWRGAGREVRICKPPTGDFNDLIPKPHA